MNEKEKNGKQGAQPGKPAETSTKTEPAPVPEQTPAAPPAVEPEEPSQKVDIELYLDAENRYRRAAADLANLHKRFAKEREQVGGAAIAAFVKKLLPVIDSFELSLKAAESAKDIQSVKKGFELIASQLQAVLAESGIKRIETKGKKFDPEFHHAIMMEPTDKVLPGTITEETAPGFIMGEVVLRPAHVKVAAELKKG